MSINFLIGFLFQLEQKISNFSPDLMMLSFGFTSTLKAEPLNDSAIPSL